jgi:hypothetical protein
MSAELLDEAEVDIIAHGGDIFFGCPFWDLNLQYDRDNGHRLLLLSGSFKIDDRLPQKLWVVLEATKGAEGGALLLRQGVNVELAHCCTPV